MEQNKRAKGNANSGHSGTGQTMQKFVASFLLVLMVLEAQGGAATKFNNIDLPLTPGRRSLNSKANKSGLLRLELMHPLHVDLPFGLPNLTFSQRLQLMTKSTTDRMNYWNNKSSLEHNSTFGMTDIQKTIYSYSYSYLVPINIGTDMDDDQPWNFWGILDIGLDLTWVKCKSFDTINHQKDDLIFNPQRSKTYENFTCSGREDKELCQTWQDERRACRADSCRYSFRYRKWMLKGRLGFDKFTFVGHRTLTHEWLLFGCEEDQNMNFQTTVGGLGLARGARSILTQMDLAEFSYCLVDINSGQRNLAGSLVIGHHQVTNTTVYATMVRHPYQLHLYYLKLKWIVVGDVPMRVPPETMLVRNRDGTGGMAIDTMLVFTCFQSDIFIPVRDQINTELSLANIRTHDPIVYHGESGLKVCYNMEGIADPYSAFPKVTFIFEPNAQVELPPQNLFIMGEGENAHIACLALVEDTSERKINILGSFQQQNFRIIFDSDIREIGFEPYNCAST